MPETIFLLLIFAVLLVTPMIMTKVQLNKSKKVLLRLSNYSFEKIPVRFLQSSVGKGSVMSGFTIKAIMYLSENLMVITPKEKGLFNGLFNINLPVVFVRDSEALKNITGISNVVKPDKVSVSAWNSILIKYEKPLLFNVKYSIQINILNKNDIEKTGIIKNWSITG